ncbi:MAG: ATP-grasp fold amidoligase family protein [bacterium]
MNFYKKIVRNQNTRFKLLGLLKWVPDKTMIKIQYRMKTGRKLNINKPKRYTEKIQWYKLYYKNPIFTQCADKYRVRKYVRSKGLGDILNRLYGVYENIEEINFDKLPKKFVIKTINGSGTNIFCKDKDNLDIDYVNKRLKNFFMRSSVSAGREWCYYNISQKIIIEEFLEDENNPGKSINDYKFLCFNGQVKYIVLDVDRFTNHKRNFYDVNWKYLKVDSDCSTYGDIVKKPAALEDMIDVANKLAEKLPAVRVDLYWVNGRIYFGEMTFYPWSGYVNFNPDEFDFVLGNEFELPNSILA